MVAQFLPYITAKSMPKPKSRFNLHLVNTLRQGSMGILGLFR